MEGRLRQAVLLSFAKTQFVCVFNNFECVCCDTLYGRSYWLRRKIAGTGLIYMADVPADTQVYLEKPRSVCIPKILTRVGELSRARGC